RSVHPRAVYGSDHPGRGRPDSHGRGPVVPLDVADIVNPACRGPGLAGRPAWRGADPGRPLGGGRPPGSRRWNTHVVSRGLAVRLLIRLEFNRRNLRAV